MLDVMTGRRVLHLYYGRGIIVEKILGRINQGYIERFDKPHYIVRFEIAHEDLKTLQDINSNNVVIDNNRIYMDYDLNTLDSDVCLLETIQHFRKRKFSYAYEPNELEYVGYE